MILLPLVCLSFSSVSSCLCMMRVCVSVRLAVDCWCYCTCLHCVCFIATVNQEMFGGHLLWVILVWPKKYLNCVKVVKPLDPLLCQWTQQQLQCLLTW